MNEKYLLSICFIDYRQEIFSEPFGLFNSFLEAEIFADRKIDELRREFMNNFGSGYDIDDYYEFDFTIKKLISDPI